MPARAAEPLTSATMILPSVSTLCFSAGVSGRTTRPSFAPSASSFAGWFFAACDAGSSILATRTLRFFFLPPRHTVSRASLPGRVFATMLERSTLCSMG